MKRLATLALLGGLLALNPTTAQDRKTGPDRGQPRGPAPDDAPALKRTVFHLRNADPAALAPVLAQHYRGQATVSTLPGVLVVSAPPVVLDEMTTLVTQLDQKSQTVEVEIILTDIAVKKSPDGKDAEVDLGPDPAAKVDALAKAGLATVQRIKLTAVEGQPVTSTTGGNKPVVSGAVVAGGRGGPGGGGPGGGGFGGGVQRSVSYHAVGTTVKMTARVGADAAVNLDLNVQDSKVRPAEAGEETGAAAFDTATLVTQLNIPAGKAVAAQSVRTEGKSGATVTLVVVTARVVTAGKARG